jgi:hypothetical protein
VLLAEPLLSCNCAVLLQFWNYTVGSAIGIIPGVLLYTLIGRLASSIAEVANGSVKTNPVVLIVSVVISIIVLSVVVVLLTRYAKKALAEQVEDPQGQDVETANVGGPRHALHQASLTRSSPDSRVLAETHPVALVEGEVSAPERGQTGHGADQVAASAPHPPTGANSKHLSHPQHPLPSAAAPYQARKPGPLREQSTHERPLHPSDTKMVFV